MRAGDGDERGGGRCLGHHHPRGVLSPSVARKGLHARALLHWLSTSRLQRVGGPLLLRARGLHPAVPSARPARPSSVPDPTPVAADGARGPPSSPSPPLAPHLRPRLPRHARVRGVHGHVGVDSATENGLAPPDGARRVRGGGGACLHTPLSELHLFGDHRLRSASLLGVRPRQPAQILAGGLLPRSGGAPPRKSDVEGRHQQRGGRVPSVGRRALRRVRRGPVAPSLTPRRLATSPSLPPFSIRLVSMQRAAQLGPELRGQHVRGGLPCRGLRSPALGGRLPPSTGLPVRRPPLPHGLRAVQLCGHQPHDSGGGLHRPEGRLRDGTLPAHLLLHLRNGAVECTQNSLRPTPSLHHRAFDLPQPP